MEQPASEPQVDRDRDGIFVEQGKGRTLVARVRLWTDGISTGGKGFILPGVGWYSGTIAFAPNQHHGVQSSPDPATFNSPEELGDALLRAAVDQRVTLLDPKTGHPLR
jgi:hypothetical protein